MRTTLKIIAALALFGIGVLAGRYFSSPEAPQHSGLSADPDLARAVFQAGEIELTDSSCALSTPPGAQATVTDFILSYARAAALPPGQSVLNAECGGRGEGKCSVSYGVISGEKADTNILLFARDSDGNLIAGEVTCIAQ